MKIFCLWIALLGSAFAAANDPAAAALAYLEKIRLGTVNLEPGQDTALSPHTAIEKKQEISRRITRLAAELGKGRLETGEIKVDDNLAAVLVRNTGGFDPSRMRVFAIGVVKIKNAWVPAPVPASFENTGFGFPSSLRQRTASLETWMLRQQVTDLEQLRERSTEKMRQDILGAMEPKFLSSSTPEEITRKFFAACLKKDLPAVLGCLGGLQKQLPENWSERLRFADAALSGNQAPWAWRLLTAPEVIRVQVDDGGESNENLLSFACLDPAGPSEKTPLPKIEILHIELSRDSDRLWRINLPPQFFDDQRMEESEDDDEVLQSLIEGFPAAVRAESPATPAATLEEAADRLGRALAANSFWKFIALMNLEGDPGTAGRGCALAARTWWQLHHPGARKHPLFLDAKEQGESGIVSFQFFSPRESGMLDVKNFYYEKTPAGWLLIPGMKLTNSPSEAEVTLRSWASNLTRTWTFNWQAMLLANTEKLDSVKSGNAPDPEAARKLVESWFEITRKSDIDAALQSSVAINRQGGNGRLLQNLGYEIGAAAKDNNRQTITSIEQGKTWTVVGVKSETAGSVAYPLYLVVHTGSGPRLLLEADLFAKASVGRELLNDAVLRRVKDFADPEANAELLEILAKFQKSVAD